MPRFEVHIPAAQTAGFNVTFRVEAENWMAALKTGMQKLGEQGSEVHNILVDLQDDDSVHVTESSTGRVFRIRELASTEKKSLAPSRPVAVDAADKKSLAPPQPVAVAPEHKKSLSPSAVAPAARPATRIQPERTAATVAADVRPEPRPAKKSRREEVEDLLADVFERVQEVHSKSGEDAALYFLLDLALEKIPAESGTVFSADLGSGNLTFRAVRGPKAKELLDAKLVIPAGTGIVGFCAAEGVTLALSDVQKDPRYSSLVAERVNYAPKSLLCAPMMTHGRSFGCLQLLNKHGGATFDEVEVGVASYIAHQAALYLNSR